MSTAKSRYHKVEFQPKLPEKFALRYQQFWENGDLNLLGDINSLRLQELKYKKINKRVKLI